MTGCPSHDEWQALFEPDLPREVEERLAAHLEVCATCRERWDQISGSFDRVVTDGESVPAPPEFLTRFQQQLPEELLATERNANDNRPAVAFPGPPTPQGKLGQIEHFHIREELGRGATGIVFHAWDEKLDREVAVKILKPESYAIDLVRTRFER